MSHSKEDHTRKNRANFHIEKKCQGEGERKSEKKKRGVDPTNEDGPEKPNTSEGKKKSFPRSQTGRGSEGKLRVFEKSNTQNKGNNLYKEKTLCRRSRITQEHEKEK